MVYRTGEMRYYYDKADLRSVVERLNEEEKKYYDAVVEQLDTIRNALETLANTIPLAANRNEELNMLKHSARLEEERDRFMDRMFHKYPIVPSEFVWKEEPVATPLCAREPPVARKGTRHPRQRHSRGGGGPARLPPLLCAAPCPRCRALWLVPALAGAGIGPPVKAGASGEACARVPERERPTTEPVGSGGPLIRPGAASPGSG